MSQLIIEICPREPRASTCLMNGEDVSTDPDIFQHLEDCNRSGDCEPASNVPGNLFRFGFGLQQRIDRGKLSRLAGRKRI